MGAEYEIVRGMAPFQELLSISARRSRPRSEAILRLRVFVFLLDATSYTWQAEEICQFQVSIPRNVSQVFQEDTNLGREAAIRQARVICPP